MLSFLLDDDVALVRVTGKRRDKLLVADELKSNE